MITYKDVENKAMPPEKKEQCKHDWFSYYIGRKITYWLTIPFLYTKLTPNHITFLSIMMLVTGFIINCFARSRGIMIVSWLCYFLWSLLDGVDGNVARYRKQFSKMGDFYDTMGGYAAYALMYLGFGIYAYFNSKFINLHENNFYYIIIGALSSLACIFPRLLYQRARANYNEIKGKAEESNKKGIKDILATNVLSITGGVMVLSLVAIVIGFMDVFTIGYAILNLLSMLYSIRHIIKEVGK